MRSFSLKLIIVMATLIALDFLWLTFLFDGSKLSPLSPLIRINGGSEGALLPPSIVVYALLAWSFLYFSWRTTIRQKTVQRITHSALLGLGLFSVYECTNYISFPNLDVRFLVADVIWGAFLFSLSGVVTALFERFSQSEETLLTSPEHG
ncbi:MAG: DUF2177 family protein [Verrucomicrobiota bacterium]